MNTEESAAARLKDVVPALRCKLPKKNYWRNMKARKYIKRAVAMQRRVFIRLFFSVAQNLLQTRPEVFPDGLCFFIFFQYIYRLLYLRKKQFYPWGAQDQEKSNGRRRKTIQRGILKIKAVKPWSQEHQKTDRALRRNQALKERAWRTKGGIRVKNAPLLCTNQE